MDIKFEELIDKPEIIEITKSQCNLRIEYEQFKNSIDFKMHTNILIIIHKENGYNKEELCFENLNMQVIGTNKRKLLSFFKRLYIDIIDNKIIIIFFLLLLIVIFKIINNSTENLKNLNDAIINVISIFIGTLFVFITLFYEDENKIDSMIEMEKFEINSENDKYVFNISLISLVCVLLSNSLIEIKYTNNIIYTLKEYIKLNFSYLYYFIKENISFFFTSISIILLIICFTSITEYYLKKIKSNAINRKILYFKEEYDKENKS